MTVQKPKGIFKEDLEYANSSYIFFQKSCHTHDIFYLCFKIFFCKNCDKDLKGKNDLTHKRLFRSQAEIKTDNPIWNSSSSCNECGETFASKSKPRIPAEVPLKLKKGGVFRLHVFNLVAQLTLIMIGQNVTWRTSFLIKTFTTQEAREETKEEVEKDIWKICKSPNTSDN